MKGYTKQQVLEAITQSRGVVSVVAHRLGCAWATAVENSTVEHQLKVVSKDGRLRPARQRTEAERQELIERAQESEQNQLLSSGSAVHFLYSSA